MIKTKPTIFASLVMLSLFASTVTFGNAFAQEPIEVDRIVDAERHYKPHAIVAGAGAAVSDEDKGHRSHFKLGIIQEEEGEDESYTVKRGKFVAVTQDHRNKFEIIPETWYFEVDSERTSFAAAGMVENKNGVSYMVEIKGEKIDDLQHGTLYYVTGEAFNETDEFSLYYITAMFERDYKIRPLPVDGSQ